MLICFLFCGSESIRNAGFPQLIPPVVQMCRDLAEAHSEPSSASAALQSLRHRSINSATVHGDSGSSQQDPSLFSNVRFVVQVRLYFNINPCLNIISSVAIFL